MANNDWLKHFKGFEETAKRFDDLIERCLLRHTSFLTYFLDENEQDVLRRVAGNRVKVSFWGGYEEAERKRALINGDEEDFEVVLLKAKFSKFTHPQHRDCKGALYNCGARSDQIGDILADEQCVRVFVSENIQDHICMNCTQIGRSKVTFAPSAETLKIEKKMSVQSFVVSSTRLDVIVSCIARCSRSKAQELIRANCVQVNHIPLEDCSALCHNNCMLSIRGYGRFQYLGAVSKTRKDRIVVEIGFYQ